MIENNAVRIITMNKIIEFLKKRPLLTAAIGVAFEEIRRTW